MFKLINGDGDKSESYSFVTDPIFQTNPKRLQESFINILKAYKSFRMETHEI